MQKKLISGLFWVLLTNLLVKPFWLLGVEVGVQNAVGPEMYGFYFTIFNISYIFNILLDLGITNFNTRNIARHPRLVVKHLSGLLSIKLLLLALYLVVTFSVGLLKGFSSSQFLLLAILSFNQFLNSLTLYLRSNYEGLLLFKWDSIFSVMDRALMIVICGILLWGPKISACNFHFSVFHFALAQTASYLITAAIALIVLVRRIRKSEYSDYSEYSKRSEKPNFKLRWNKPFAIAILKQSLPFALLVLLMASYNRIDPILLEQLSPHGRGDFYAGIYAGAFRLLDALTMIAYLVSVPLLPIYSRLTKLHDLDEIRDTTRTVFSLVMVFAITAACSLASVSDDIMALFYDDNVSEYSSVFPIVILCIIPISVTYIFGTLLTAGGFLRHLNIFAACSLAVNIGVNLLLIPRFAAVGSAWAGLSAQSIMAMAQIVAAMKIFKMKLSWRYIIKLTLFTLSVVACSLWLPRFGWMTSVAMCGCVAVAMALLLRLIDIKEMIKTINNKNIQKV